jgi:hypothetical protein
MNNNTLSFPKPIITPITPDRQHYPSYSSLHIHLPIGVEEWQCSLSPHKPRWWLDCMDTATALTVPATEYLTLSNNIVFVPATSQPIIPTSSSSHRNIPRPNQQSQPPTFGTTKNFLTLQRHRRQSNQKPNHCSTSRHLLHSRSQACH